MRNITITCPNCGAPDKAVGDPDESAFGHSGKWYCFSCQSEGTYTMLFEMTKGATAKEAMEAP